jgi:hypothetical protein
MLITNYLLSFAQRSASVSLKVIHQLSSRAAQNAALDPDPDRRALEETWLKASDADGCAGAADRAGAAGRGGPGAGSAAACC